MAANKSQRDGGPRLWPVVLLVVAIIAVGVANYLGLLGNLHFMIGPFFSHHWMSIVGATLHRGRCSNSALSLVTGPGTTSQPYPVPHVRESHRHSTHHRPFLAAIESAG